MGSFPRTRLRRTRKHGWLRDMVAESSLEPTDLIYPMFVVEGKNVNQAIKTLPSVSRLSIDLMVKEAKKAKSLGIPAIAIFPSIDRRLKCENGKEALNPNNLICRAVKAIKDNVDIGVICDVALDPYTSHGHDGILVNGDVDNDKTIDLLADQAELQAGAGCDILAPSDKMDGTVSAIRKSLDRGGFTDKAILSYSVKYASKFYGPFRDAVASRTKNKECNKLTYQMDFRNAEEALREVEMDIEEGADMVIVKPGMPYLDIVRQVKDRFNVPVIAYQVSGEYAMLKFAAEKGCFDYMPAMYESLIAFKRAGASAILTYAALEVAKTM